MSKRGYKLTEEHIIRIKLAMTGKKRKPFSDITKKKMSESKRGEKHPFYGKHHTKISIDKISKTKTGVKKSKTTRIKMSESRFGNKNHQWRGGISFEPYPTTFNEAFKKFVREYYGNICINCGKTREENKHELTCHHYDYDKNSTNCVPVCNSCNAIANGSRNNGSRAFWEDWYVEILNEFYNKTLK